VSTSRQRRHIRSGLCALVCMITLSAAWAAGDMMHDHHDAKSKSKPPTGAEAAYLAENEAAMNVMMANMAAKPTGDIDRDFVAMMEPHHRGAIAMAESLLRYSKNEKLRQIAQDIVAKQQQEIVEMHLAIGDAPPAITTPK
jgi:uncharacterized protein (DUF305 family)